MMCHDVREQLSALIDDLFALSRLEAGDIQWSMERVDLADLVGDTVGAMRPQARARGVQMDFAIPIGLQAARADGARLQRVLFNLIQNAIRYTPADGSVTVRAEVAEGAVQVEVADTGTGIADADRERVFDAFFQGGARSNGSAGLGLAISRAIVEAHGGRIWLERSVGGTSVRFTLPGV